MGWIIFAVLAAFLVWRILLGYPAPDRSYEHLSRMEVALLDAVGEAVFPPGGAISPSWRDTGLVAYVDRYLGWHAPPNRLLMHLLFFLLEHATLIFLPSLRRCSQLPREQVVRYLEGWENSRLYLRRMVFSSLRAILCLCYCADPKVAEELGIFRPEDCANNAVES